MNLIDADFNHSNAFTIWKNKQKKLYVKTIFNIIMAMDLLGTIVGILIYLGIVALCCTILERDSQNTPAPKTNSKTTKRQNTYSTPYDFCECPSCGAPGYDGYCEECGYPDINQGWIGENY